MAGDGAVGPALMMRAIGRTVQALAAVARRLQRADDAAGHADYADALSSLQVVEASATTFPRISVRASGCAHRGVVPSPSQEPGSRMSLPLSPVARLVAFNNSERG